MLFEQFRKSIALVQLTAEEVRDLRTDLDDQSVDTRVYLLYMHYGNQCVHVGVRVHIGVSLCVHLSVYLSVCVRMRLMTSVLTFFQYNCFTVL